MLHFQPRDLTTHMHAAVSSRLVSLALLKKYKARGGVCAERGVVGSAHAGGGSVGASSFTSSSSPSRGGVRERKTNAIDVFRFVQNHRRRRADDEEAEDDEKKRSKDVVVIFAWFEARRSTWQSMRTCMRTNTKKLSSSRHPRSPRFRRN